jgi:hypothetical protein
MDRLRHSKMYCSSVTTRFLANRVKNGVSVEKESKNGTNTREV